MTLDWQRVVEHEARRPLTTLEYLAFLGVQRLRTAYILSLEFVISVVEFFHQQENAS